MFILIILIIVLTLTVITAISAALFRKAVKTSVCIIVALLTAALCAVIAFDIPIYVTNPYESYLSELTGIDIDEAAVENAEERSLLTAENVAYTKRTVTEKKQSNVSDAVFSPSEISYDIYTFSSEEEAERYAQAVLLDKESEYYQNLPEKTKNLFGENSNISLTQAAKNLCADASLNSNITVYTAKSYMDKADEANIVYGGFPLPVRLSTFSIRTGNTVIAVRETSASLRGIFNSDILDGITTIN